MLAFRKNRAYTDLVTENSDDNPNKSNEESFGKAPALSDDSAVSNEELASLEDIDQMLYEEDPEFFKQIADIHVESSAGDLSIMDDVITNMSRSNRNQIQWRFHFQNLFLIKDDPKKHLFFWFLIIAAVGLVFFGSKFSSYYFSKGLFLRSFAEWNSDVQTYNPLTEAEPFYDNPRFAKNLITLSKMVTNVKPSENSGPNPMLALELSVEGMSAEAVIEIKDREAEFKDILLRKAEEYNYDDLGSADGKKVLLENFTTLINANLSQGQVRRSLIKSIILKP